jgi:UDP-N-acetylglucosamine 2-epimerase
MIKVATVVGARPQFIKTAAVSRVIEKRRGTISETLIHTGQHYDYEMSEVFFRELDIPTPAYHLDVGSGSHAWQTGQMLERLEQVLVKERPSLVLVYGDTNSTLAGALAARTLQIPVAHVEAGVRSFNRRMIEEINRRLTDNVATFLFCPTRAAVDNLAQEGIKGGVLSPFSWERYVVNVGDVMLDSILQYRVRAEEASTLLRELEIVDQPYLLATIHRAENTDDPRILSDILHALKELSFQQVVIFPAHPRTRKAIATLGERKYGNLRFIDPTSYLDMIALIAGSRIVLTDSGGIQKEAFFLHVPCVTLRSETEWMETVECGWNVVAGTSGNEILDGVRRVLEMERKEGIPLFGAGDASEKIVSFLERQVKG